MDLNQIVHLGTVTKVSKEGIEVILDGEVGCEACHAKGACSMPGKEDKKILVNSGRENFQPGEKVEVLMSTTLGLKATMWAYVIPFFVLLFTLIVSLAFTTELFAGLITLSVVLLYYLVLFLNQKKLDKTFSI